MSGKSSCRVVGQYSEIEPGSDSGLNDSRGADSPAATSDIVGSQGSITGLFPALRQGDPLADQAVWKRYFEQLVREVRRRLASTHRRASDEEDVALSAFRTFFEGIEEGRFPQLTDREDLWKLLVTLARRKVASHVEHERAQKRGGGEVRGESAFGSADGSEFSAGIGAIADDAGGLRSPVPTPEEVAAVIDLQEHLFARLTDDLQQIATLKLDGLTNVEIGQRIGKSEALVRLKLQRIQKLWRDYCA